VLPNTRLVALDHLRGFIVGLVVLHHAVLAYCRFGHIDHHHYLLSTAPVVDSQRWAGFDILVLLNDSFFMPLMFLLSGLFVWGSLSRKGAWSFFRGRSLRLGLPFAVAVLTLVPLAYYPSWLEAGGEPGFAAFWGAMLIAGPWPSGPAWFVAVLLVFDVAAALIFSLLGRATTKSEPPTMFGPARCFAVLWSGSLLVYLPLLAAFGPSRWLSIGPFAIQGSRVGLYAAYFGAGVVLGAAGFSNSAAFRNALVRRWLAWILICVLAGAALIGVGIALLHTGSTWPSWMRQGVYGSAVAGFCAAACLALPALFLRFDAGRGAAWDSLAASSFTIYLLHYPVVTWVQYGLLHATMGALPKAVLTFACALLVSWGGAVLLRRVPGVARLV
jgi:glucan biosynthesis protein C